MSGGEAAKKAHYSQSPKQLVSPCFYQAGSKEAPFHFVDVAAFGFIVIKCMRIWVGDFTWGSVYVYGGWGSRFWKHFILEGKKMGCIPLWLKHFS